MINLTSKKYCVWESVWSSVSNDVRCSVLKTVDESAWDSVWSSVGNRVRDSVSSFVYSVRSGVRESTK